MKTWKGGPAYRIITKRLIIRCYNPEDAGLLAQSISESVDHLKPWMPWAHEEPESIETKINRLRRFRANFDLDEEYVYGVFDPEEIELIGGTGLHPRVGHKALEIGYWINVNHLNQGYATETAGALTKVGFEINRVKRMEIHCLPNNVASASIPKKLGYLHEATLRKRQPNEKEELNDTMIWSMLKEEYESSTLKDLPIKVYNAVGNQIL
jgi:RimJ/RimL family protein N-acetyltransferase